MDVHMNEYIYKQCNNITNYFIGWGMCIYFVEKVKKEELPDYYDVISHPMWLRKIKLKLDNKEYKTLQSYIDDMNLIWKNAIKYNGDADASTVGLMARIAEYRFNQKVNKISATPQERYLKKVIKIVNAINENSKRFEIEIDHAPTNYIKM